MELEEKEKAEKKKRGSKAGGTPKVGLTEIRLVPNHRLFFRSGDPIRSDPIVNEKGEALGEIGSEKYPLGTKTNDVRAQFSKSSITRTQAEYLCGKRVSPGPAVCKICP